MTTWSLDQIVALAPDEASVKAGRGLASQRKWVSVHRSERAVWGECQGSGKDPYRTQIDLTEPALKCNCPSRKFPCKHGLGLFLLFAQQPTLFSAANEPPAWVKEWLQKRDATQQKKAAKATAETADAAAAEADPEKAAEREAARAKRAAGREQKVRAGLDELTRWLHDLIRQGLPIAQQQPRRFLDMAGRMVDAQAPGVARLLRECPSLVASGEGWADRLLHQLGLIHLLTESYSRLDALPEPVRADVRTAIGWTIQESELVGPPVEDKWVIAGQCVTEEDGIRAQRTWLLGSTSKQIALVLHFAAFNQKLDISLIPGMEFAGRLVYYPSNAPLRAVVREREPSVAATRMPAFSLFEAALVSSAEMLGRNPFIERTAFAVSGTRIIGNLDDARLVDAEANRIPLELRFQQIPELFAISGGHPVTLFGEWNGSAFLPLSILNAGRITPLGGAATL